MSEAPAITSFSGEHKFLSNFYMRTFSWDGKFWRSSEHAFQATKMERPQDAETVRAWQSPSEAKKAARKLPMRIDWDRTKLEYMYQILCAKFAEGRIERDLLLRTGDAYLIEGNTWGDMFWGQIELGGTLRGHNHLGKILMRIREEARD